MAECIGETAVKKLLMIAYFFPPVGGIGAAGSQRVLKFAKYLPNYGWQSIILTGKEAYYESYLSFDRTMLEKVPPDITIVRTAVIRWLSTLLKLRRSVKTHFHPNTRAVVANGPNAADSSIPIARGRYQCLKDTITDLFEIPDEEIGWFLPGVYAGLRVMKSESIDAIYSTGRPWTAHLIGAALQWLTGKPLAIDFRDPWLTNPFRRHYSPLKQHLESVFEKRVIEKADVVIANTRELQLEFIRRFPQLPSAKFVTLLNGFDPDDSAAGTFSEKPGSNHCFTMVHTGFLYGKRDPATFLEAVKLLVQEQALDRQKLMILLVGSVELPYDLPERLVKMGLQDIILLQDHVPHRQSLEYLRRSDILLLLQPGTTTQIPSKLFEYVGMQKPILAVSPRDGATSRLVLDESLGVVADSYNVLEIKRALAALYQAWLERRLSSTFARGAHKKFDARNVAADLATTLSHLYMSSARPV